MKLPKYSECQYSLFISYAHRDNSANNSWVTNLKEAVYFRLDNLERSITKKEIHFSELNGPVAGETGAELDDRIGKSFAILLVVGPQYASSGWCENELTYFEQRLGEEGIKSRLLIAVMTDKALELVQAGTMWKRLVAPNQLLWVRMYHPSDPKKPLDSTPNRNQFPISFPQIFFDQASLLADKLQEWIQMDEVKSQTASPNHGASTCVELLSPWSVPSSRQPQIVIGPCTENLKTMAEHLRDSLAKIGAHVSLLAPTVMVDYDPADGKPLRPVFEKADVLIMPITNKKPLRPDIPGGHATLIGEEWSKLNKSRGIIWYRPTEVEVSSEDSASQMHIEKLSQLAPVCQSMNAVISLIFGAERDDAIKLYVEQHPQEPVYFKLTNRLSAAWKSLSERGKIPQNLPLICEPLVLNTLESMPPHEARKMLMDAAGVVLVLPQNKKGSSILRSQQKLIEESDGRRTGINYPGCVALIYKEPNLYPSGEKWVLVEFLASGEGQMLNVDADNTGCLDAFLTEVMNQRQVTSPTSFH